MQLQGQVQQLSQLLQTERTRREKLDELLQMSMRVSEKLIDAARYASPSPAKPPQAKQPSPQVPNPPTDEIALSPIPCVDLNNSVYSVSSLSGLSGLQVPHRELEQVQGDVRELRKVVETLQSAALSTKLQQLQLQREEQMRVEEERRRAELEAQAAQVARQAQAARLRRPPKMLATLWAHGLDVWHETGGPSVLGLALYLGLHEP